MANKLGRNPFENKTSSHKPESIAAQEKPPAKEREQNPGCTTQLLAQVAAETIVLGLKVFILTRNVFSSDSGGVTKKTSAR
jgi:hypothetical protein